MLPSVSGLEAGPVLMTITGYENSNSPNTLTKLANVTDNFF
jgi:hypothetical protein